MAGIKHLLLDVGQEIRYTHHIGSVFSKHNLANVNSNFG